MKVDLVAHHSIQSGCIEPIINNLNPRFQCSVRIGANFVPDKGEMAIVTDHLAFQKYVTKKYFKYLVHASHDLSDLEIYKTERRRLSEFDLILCPGVIHYEQCRKYLPKVTAVPVGWMKYGQMPLKRYRFGTQRPKGVLLALTDVGYSPWERVIKELVELDIPVYIKNHVYYDADSGLNPPPGLEEEYEKHLTELKRFQSHIATQNYSKVATLDPKAPITNFFSLVDVLVTDWSSAAVEFLPFGESIEIGKFPRKNHYKDEEIEPSSSKIVNEVIFVDFKDLSCQVSKMIEKGAHSCQTIETRSFDDFCFTPSSHPRVFAADVVNSVFLG
jgi:hypothetical protein